VLEDAAHYLQRRGLAGRHSTIVKPILPRQTNCYITNGSLSVDLESKSKLFVLSSSDQDGVKRVVASLTNYLHGKPQGHPGHEQSLLNNLAYTLGEQRTIMPWKSFAIASDVQGLITSLGKVPAANRSSDSRSPKIAFVFTGQGAQWYSMGKSLVTYDVYRNSLESCENILHSLGCTWSLAEELNRSEVDTKLNLAEFSQPACTALQIALVDILQHWGVTPSAVAGHSSGEIAAAYCSGAISRETAMTIAWFRGQFARDLATKNVTSKGAMMAVSIEGDCIRPQLSKLTRGFAVVACNNSPNSCTISGDVDAIDELGVALSRDQIMHTKLKVEVAYHSPHMETIRGDYEAAISGINFNSGVDSIPMFSSVTGTLISPEKLGPTYWANNLTSPVNFTGAIRSLLHYSETTKRSVDHAAFASVFLEVGPHSALRSYLLDIFKSEERVKNLSYVNMLRRGHDGVDTTLQALGTLFTKGCNFKLGHVNETPSDVSLATDLPPYPWNHSTSFWNESYLSQEHRFREFPRMDLLGAPVAGSIDPQWRNFLRVAENPWIKEHCVQGKILYPGAGMLVMAIEAARQTAAPNEVISSYELRDVSISTALQIPDDDKGIEVVVQFHKRRTGTKAAPSNTLNEFTVSSWSKDSSRWQVHCRGLVSVTYKSQITTSMKGELALESQFYASAFQEARSNCQKPARNFLYDNVESIGMKYGPIFRNITELYAGDNSSYGVIKIPDTKSIMPGGFEYPCVIHPATLDSVLHLLFPSISGVDQTLSEAVVPYSIDRLFISADVPTTPNTNLHGFSSAQKASYTTWTSSITILTEDCTSPVIIMEGLGLASVGGSDVHGSHSSRAECFETLWHEDADLMSSDQVKSLVYKRTIPNADDDSVLDKLEYVCLVYMQRILDWFNAEGKDHIPQSGFFGLYYQWLNDTMKLFPPLDKNKDIVDVELESARKRISGSESGDITVQMVDRIGQNLSKIFAKEIEPLQVMLEGDLLYTF
jgi:acyl transferase domain-containing protein